MIIVKDNSCDIALYYYVNKSQRVIINVKVLMEEFQHNFMAD